MNAYITYRVQYNNKEGTYIDTFNDYTQAHYWYVVCKAAYEAVYNERNSPHVQLFGVTKRGELEEIRV